MTTRQTIDQITSDDLDQLYDQLDRLDVVRKGATSLVEHGHDTMSARWILDTIGGPADEPARTTPNNPTTDANAPAE